MQLSKKNISKILTESRLHTDRIIQVQICYLENYLENYLISDYYLINERFYDFSKNGKIVTNIDSTAFYQYMDMIMDSTEGNAYLKVYRNINTDDFILSHPNVIKVLKLDYEFILPMNFSDISIPHLYKHLCKLNQEDFNIGRMILNGGKIVDLDNQIIYFPIYSFTLKNMVDINIRLSQMKSFRGVHFKYHLIRKDLIIKPKKVIVNLQPAYGSVVIERTEAILTKFSISYNAYLYLLDLCFKYNLTESEFTELIYDLNSYCVKKGEVDE